MLPIKAKFKATLLSLNFGHKTPGVSNKSIFSLTLIHCFFFVTPGLFPTSNLFDFTTLFINDDFPTFGIPRIITFIFLPVLPFSANFCKSSFIMFSIAFITSFIPFPELQSVKILIWPSLFSLLIQSSFCLASAKSLLFNIIIFFLFFVSSAISGF